VYGLAVIGICRPENLRRNADANVGDAIILTKPLGVGVYSAAVKKVMLSAENYSEMVSIMTKLNRIGTKLATDRNVHAMTDVTGFGLLGHALEMAQGADLGIKIHWASLPFLTEAASLAQLGCVTGASKRNWASYGERVSLPPDCPDWQRHLLTDPQTSGGLLIACAPDKASELTASIIAEGYSAARIIGSFAKGPTGILIEQ
jgi:selenide,water dikinase